jgi:isoaspartyl peptidase/L-asparaginase-like protein (Ntn-hydrolase superfamily)
MSENPLRKLHRLVLGCCIALTTHGVALASDCDSWQRYTILIHGGTVDSASELTDAHFRLMRSIVVAARAELSRGGAALDVVVDAIVRMEDSGLLNAGKGSFRNTAGMVETDASLMEGHTGRIGAVAAMQRLKNPILAARLVMDDTPHVLFAGPNGEQTLVGLGAETVEDPAAYFVPSRVPTDDKESGTVGAVAMDRCGHLAAGTSTGGYPGKLPGRVGDSPIIGASTYAGDLYALSATGRGENFIRRSVTLDIAKRAEYLGTPLQEAANFVVHRLLGDIDDIDGAVIAIGREGQIVLAAVNVLGALHGYASESTAPVVGAKIAQADIDGEH